MQSIIIGAIYLRPFCDELVGSGGRAEFFRRNALNNVRIPDSYCG
jgi:hypothetical protein